MSLSAIINDDKEERKSSFEPSNQSFRSEDVVAGTFSIPSNKVNQLMSLANIELSVNSN